MPLLDSLAGAAMRAATPYNSSGRSATLIPASSEWFDRFICSAARRRALFRSVTLSRRPQSDPLQTLRASQQRARNDRMAGHRSAKGTLQGQLVGGAVDPEVRPQRTQPHLTHSASAISTGQTRRAWENPTGVNSSHIQSGIYTGSPRAAGRYFPHASSTEGYTMKVRQTSPSDLLAHRELVPRFYELLASVDDEELLKILHDFMVPANDSYQANVSDRASGSSMPRGLPTKTPPRGLGH